MGNLDKKMKKIYNIGNERGKKVKSIYFDHAATTPLDEEVLHKMIPYLTENFGNADSPHAFGRKAMNAVDDARCKIAELIHAKPNEVYFTSGGTESGNWALLCGAYAQKTKGKKRILVSSIEHHAVKEMAEKLKKDGFEVCIIPVNDRGRVALKDVEALITEDTALVSVMAANNETGVIQPVKEIAELTHKYGALFFTDGVQAAPYMPIDVKEWNVDLLSFSSHKFYGPKGCGVLYIKSGVKAERLIIGGEQERGLRGGTLNVPAIVGMAAAYEKNVATMYASNEKIEKLKKLFLQEISVLENVHINGDTACSLPSVLNLRFDGVENTAFLYKMDLQGVCLAAGSACASASVKPSHVLLAMGLSDTQAKSSVRFSFGKNNTEEEIKIAAKLTVETVRKLRNF